MEVKEYNRAFKSLNFRNQFTDDINETSTPVGLKGPKVKPYDDTEDPNDHVSNFQGAIKMTPMDPNYGVSTLREQERCLEQRNVSSDLIIPFREYSIEYKKREGLIIEEEEELETGSSHINKRRLKYTLKGIWEKEMVETTKKIPSGSYLILRFHKKLGHTTVNCESLKRENDKEKELKRKEIPVKKKYEVVYNEEVMMSRGECSRMSIKKRKWTSIELTNSNTIPSNHQGTEPLII
ncbi:unnamed protein product [Lactuca virosa]|uniref:Uncharacterized protein n=1 Tax=Lactuca virosa TaxID=75947 RepID=A0AAU9LNB0_9ASTR|nr:unnamed protein product [Lactuca virosa]